MSITGSSLDPTAREDARLAALARYDVLDTPSEPAFDRVARLVKLVFGVSSSAVSLIDAHRQWLKASCGINVSEMPRQDTFCNQTLRSDQPLVVPDLTRDPRFCDNPYVIGDLAARFYAGVPIRTADGHNIGTVCAIDYEPREFSLTQIEILRELAEVVIDGLELRRLARTDGLTGLSTRRAFKDEAERFVELARRHRSALSVVTFDIDHFKTVNDTYGHATGDIVLKQVSEAALDTPRASDLLGRLGGEEFALLLPGADLASAMAIAENLRQRIVELEFGEHSPALAVSASFGVASLDAGRDDLDRLLVKADEALYEAKRSGRNRATSWAGHTEPTTEIIERQRMLKAGRLVFNDGSSVLDCTVRALWENGAEIQIADGDAVPDAVTLEIPGTDARRDGRVAVRLPGRLELSFR